MEEYNKKEEEKEIEKLEEKEEEKKKKKIIILLLLFLLFISIFGLSVTYGKGIYQGIENQIIKTLNLSKPTSPVITGGSNEWAKERLIRVEKDAYSKKKIAYYEYCVREEKSSKNCRWEKTETKNTVVSKSGIYYVTFRAVNEEGERGNESNIEKVYIDNNSPIIKNIKEKEITIDSIGIEVEATDELSGIKSYLYSIDGVNYEEGKLNYTYRNLEAGTEYIIYIKVVDKVGNSTVLSMKESTKSEDNKCDLNCDTNGDGKCDLNCDTDGDGKCDLNCDTDGDGKCDLNCDTDGDGKCNLNCDTDGDGKCDLNCGTLNPSPEPTITPSPTTSPSPSMTPTPTTTPKPEEEKEIPVINLDKVPSKFIYGEKYDLPSYYSFGKDTGEVQCIVRGKEYKDTTTLGIGKHLIVCEAVSSHNIRVMVEKEVEVLVEEGEEEVWDGWIRLNLYYPENSTNWEWRIGKEGEIRDGYENTEWQAYTGPILVKLSDVDDVYIRYELNGKVYVVSPSGKVAVDIEPEKYTLRKEEETEVTIYYDKDSKTKEYRIDGGEWEEYKGSFKVGPNTVIEARATKEEKVYDSEGNYLYTSKRTGTDSVFISEYIEGNPGVGGGSGTTGGGVGYEPGTNPGGETITKPIPESKPSTYLEGPIISSNPGVEIVESVKVMVTPKEVAEKIYISIGYGKFEEYTKEISVTNNTIVRAYYIRSSDGKVSETSYYYVQNIKEKNLPYVRIDATPNNYLTETQETVNVAISGRDYEKLEYSLDGVIYYPYTGSFTVTESSTIYAKGTNANGEKIETLTITTTTAPKQKEKLNIHISLNPEKEEVKGLANKTKVEISYDNKAEKKYYKIGYNGEWKEYSGTFEVTSNTTVYAYCVSSNGEGSSSKKISYLTTGISNPIITGNPTSATQQVKIEISYDENAEIKRYQIGNGPMLDYNGAFYVYENATITAYNKNVLGYEGTSQYEVKNIAEVPRYTVIDEGDYYLIKLNYPSTSDPEKREYKWKESGVWKTYDSHGILLIKPEYKDEIIGSDGVRIKDSNGKEILITDHYYLMDVPLNELMENLFMRWDTAKVKAPEILVNPTGEPVREVEVGIVYPNSLVNKYYKIVKEDGTDTGWLEYTGSFKVNENNVVIYAKGETISNNESEVSSRKITNIDLIAPEINISGDFVSPKRQVTVSVNAKDNMMMYMVKWASGEQTIEYFRENGKSIRNPGTFKVEENGKYTIYAVDQVGNESIKVIEITNIDLTAPNIIINVLTERYGPEAEVSIDYGDSKIKEYRIGESSTTYDVYTENLIIKSLDVLDLANEDGSLTIYARGEDEAGNVTEVSEKVYILDLDAPKLPDIHSTAGYPVLTEYGVKLGQDNYIIYDTRDDITNYYSLDNGTTWEIYTGPFEIKNGTIMAKSVKNSSGLTVISTKKVDMPTDALGPNAYDEDSETLEGFGNVIKRINVSSEMQGKRISIIGTSSAYREGCTIRFIGIDGTVISSNGIGTNPTYDIPMGTVQIGFYSNVEMGYIKIYEIAVVDTPVITSDGYYSIMTEYGITPGYREATIDYFPTSVQRLYRINDGDWEEYQGKPIELKLGDKLEAKGTNRYGKETLSVSSYISQLPTDALGMEAYDEDTTTYVEGKEEIKYLYISDTLYGKKLEFVIHAIVCEYSSASIDFIFEDMEGNQLDIKTFRGTADQYRDQIQIPENTKRLKIVLHQGSHRNGNSPSKIYEIRPYNNPIINDTKYYPILTEQGVIPGYNEVTISYFSTSVQRLYRINDGDWKDYQDQKIRLEIGDKIEAKGIDKYNKETPISQYTASLPDDALVLEAYDNDKSTYFESVSSYKTILVDKEMTGRYLNFLGYAVHQEYSGARLTFNFLDNEGKIIASKSYSSTSDNYSDNIIIPDDTVKIGINFVGGSSRGGSGPARLYEIGVSMVPSIIETKYYPTLSITGFSNSKCEVVINYLSYLEQKLYSLDNGTTWIDYTKPIELEEGTKVLAKAIDKDGNESGVSTYTVVGLSDDLPATAFDNNKETIASIPKNVSKIFNLDKSVYGKTLRIYTNGIPATDSIITLYNASDVELMRMNLQETITAFVIPEGGVKGVITSGSNILEIKEINIREDKQLENNMPLIEIDDFNWTMKKVVEITYPEGYQNQYSLDLGNTWQEYLEPIMIDQETVVFARTLDGEKVISSSSFSITKIDNVEPTIEINIPDIIVLTEEYNLPTSYTVGKSGGSSVCKIGEEELTNTKDLELGIHEITCTVYNNVGIEKSSIKTVKVVDAFEYQGDSILEILSRNDLRAGLSRLTVNGITYSAHLYVYNGNQNWTEDKVFGDEKDVATASTNAQNMVIVKVNGDVTIGSGVTVRPYYNTYGGPKGFTMYVTGTLTNNGTIDNSHGAKAVGENVYLWKNADGTYEYVPASGGAGGAGYSKYRGGNGNPGIAGSERGTGGGGSGGCSGETTTCGGGTAGTSYSGGTGGGGGSSSVGKAGTSNGGAGGKGGTDSLYTGGGAGNPGGTAGAAAGGNGTGGLLIIYANSYINRGTITANGTNGGSASESSGGSSGGGSINLFTNQSTGIDQLGIITDTRYNEIKGITSNVGGSAVNNGGSGIGGAGGSGTINIGEIRNGQYYDLKTIIEQDKEAYIESVTKRGDSILSILEKNDLKNGYYYFIANGVNYPVHLYVYNGNQNWTENQVFGDANDVATASTNAQNMVIVKVNGDVTIGSGVTVRPYYNTYGGPKGFTMYVTGTLTNNGTIDNSHGAKAVGENVYLWKNVDGTYEYVPASGGAGGAGYSKYRGGNGNPGKAGSERRTGGGGSGGCSGETTTCGGGTAGTSYSGGTGGGGGSSSVGKAGTSNGGAGGKGGTASRYTGGGAGNPGGTAGAAAGGTGTGGLLTIYATNYINNGTITANGTNGGSAYWSSGGSSGGGSINIFYSNTFTAGTIVANGGVAVNNGGLGIGGAGGKGTITIGKILEGSFIKQ